MLIVPWLRRLSNRVPLWHALYFGIGGLWSVVGKRSFQVVSGPKVDYWLVRTVGGLLTVVGAVIAVADVRNRLTPEIRWLAVGTSSVLAIIDAVYTTRNRIHRIYLLDAVANALLIGGWLVYRSGTQTDLQRSADMHE
jgi:hypothetical protein